MINWDQTGVNFVPASQWTQEEKGSSRVEIAGVGDKCQITVTVAGTLSGKLLPFQVLYEGKTEWCHPSLVPRPTPFFVLRFAFHGGGRVRKTGKAWEHLSRE